MSINEHKNVPLAILGLQVDSIKQLFDEGDLDRFSRLQLWETVERLTASMGRCERIKNGIPDHLPLRAAHGHLLTCDISCAIGTPATIGCIGSIDLGHYFDGLLFSREGCIPHTRPF